MNLFGACMRGFKGSNVSIWGDGCLSKALGTYLMELEKDIVCTEWKHLLRANNQATTSTD